MPRTGDALPTAGASAGWCPDHILTTFTLASVDTGRVGP